MIKLLENIISKLPKGTLVSIVIILGFYVAKLWFNDYKESQKENKKYQVAIINDIKSSDSLNQIRYFELNNQIKIVEKNVNKNVDSIRFDLSITNQKLDIIKKEQNQEVIKRLNDIDDMYKNFRILKQEESFKPIEPIFKQNLIVELPVKKKLNSRNQKTI